MKRSRRLALASLTASIAAALAVAACTSEDGAPPPAGCATGLCIDASLPDGALPAYDARAPERPDSGAAIDAAGDTTAPAADASSDDASAIDANVPDASGPIDAGSDAADAGFDAADAADASPYTVLASGQSSPWHLALGGGYVYWINGGTGISRVGVNGGAITPIAGTVNAEFIYADGTNLFFSDVKADLYQLAHGSTSPQKIGTGLAFTPSAMVSDGVSLYWTDINSSMLMHVAIGGAATTDAGVITGGFSAGGGGVAIAGGQIYVAENGGGTGTGKIDLVLGDGGLKPLATGLYGASQLITDGVHLFWVDDFSTPDQVEGMLLDGSARTKFVNSSIHPRIATDGVNLYYMEGMQNDGTIAFGPVNGPPMKTLYSLGYTSQTLAVDGTSVYWADYTNGVIYKAPK